MNPRNEASPSKPDILGTAMLDYINGRPYENIETRTSVAGLDELPVPYLFRAFDEMPELERKALKMAVGSVLDIGCGSGSHALWLQEKGLEVKAIDISPGAIETCRIRGVKNAEVQDIWKLEGETFDTLLMLMNGMGICGRLEKLPDLLKKLKSLLNPGGQILADSSDLIYMFEDEDAETLPSDHYYGEVQFETRYKDLQSDTFPWLYVDFHNLALHASHAGLKCEMICPGEHYDYLARLTRQ
jgi:SAM-dependent methyltransferase